MFRVKENISNIRTFKNNKLQLYYGLVYGEKDGVRVGFLEKLFW